MNRLRLLLLWDVGNALSIRPHLNTVALGSSLYVCRSICFRKERSFAENGQSPGYALPASGGCDLVPPEGLASQKL